MKLGMSHYDHKSIPDAKLEFDGSSSFGDMTSQNFSQKKGTSHQIRLFTPENRFRFKKMGFYFQNHSSRPKIDPPLSISAIFKQRKILSFGKFFRRLNDKRAAATPLIDQFCYNLVRTCIKDKN